MSALGEQTELQGRLCPGRGCRLRPVLPPVFRVFTLRLWVPGLSPPETLGRA